MPVPIEGVKRWFRDSNGKVSQINNVVEITFGSPLIANGYYRDKPPIVVGGASISGEGVSRAVAASVAGGVDPDVAITSVTNTVSAKGASSVLQDDDFTHVDLRFIWSPVPLVFFRTTDDLIIANPDGTSFPIARPVTNFEVFNVDCVFGWGEDCEIWNVPPPGWSVGDSGPALT
jgi:hypothetical protein